MLGILESSEKASTIILRDAGISDRIYCVAEIRRDATAKPSIRSVDVIASTNAIDSYRERVEQKWNLERFKANPVVLFAHDRAELPIGLASNIRVEDGALRATITLVSDEVNARSGDVWRAIEAGVLRGVSVGFKPHSRRWEKENETEILVLSDNELIEISIVPVPANPETLLKLRSLAAGERKKTEMDPELIAALGLNPSASKADALRAIATMREGLATMLSASGETEVTRGVARVISLAETAKSLEILEKKYAAEIASRETLERSSILADARRRGLITPGIEEREAFKRLASGPVEALRTAIEVMSPQVPQAVEAPANAPPTDAVTLSSEDLAACKSSGQDPKEFLEFKRAKLSAGKAA